MDDFAPLELLLELPDALLPAAPRGTAWPLLALPADVLCCGASSRYADRLPPKPMVGIDVADGLDVLVVLAAAEPLDDDAAGAEDRAPLSPLPAAGRSTATGRSAAGLPPDSPGF